MHIAVNSALTYTVFTMLLLEFRIKAPGAKTYAQFILKRFGLVAHLASRGVALFTSLYGILANITSTSLLTLKLTRLL